MDLAARDKLIEDNIGLVGYFTGRYARKLAGKLDYDEVYSAANFGLVKAASAYEPGRGAFSTFAGMCIWRRCLMDLRGKRKDALTVSLDAPLPGDTENITLADVVPDIRADFEEAVADRDRLHRMLAVLSPSEKKLLLDSASGVTQKALAKQLGISQALVSRRIIGIRRRALAMTELHILDREEFVERAVFDLGLDLPKKSTPERRKPMEQKTAASLAERAALYNALRAAGANPDEAAQGAGWKNFNSAQGSLKQNGIKISAKVSADKNSSGEAPLQPTASEIALEPSAPTPEPPTPEPACALIPGKMALVDKPRALRPVSWQGKDFLYVDNGGYIEIIPRESTAIQLSYDALKQFSEELQELLEIIQ